MRMNARIVGSGLSMAANVNTQGVDLQYYFGVSLHAVWSGSAQGTLKLQVSNDTVVADQAGINMAGDYTVPTDPADGVINWADYTGSIASTTSYASASAGSLLWNAADSGYRWIRAAYVSASGSGTLTVNFLGKGI